MAALFGQVYPEAFDRRRQQRLGISGVAAVPA
jgi:hypothetical protein